MQFDDPRSSSNVHNSHSHDAFSLTECNVCHQPFVEPKLLPCIHSFCLGCLERVEVASRAANGGRPVTDAMNCPTCGDRFSIPTAAAAGGLAGLRSSFFVEKLVEINKISVSAVRPCSFCTGKNKNENGRDPAFSPKKENKALNSPNKRASVVPSKLFCVDCQRSACAECGALHQVHCKSHAMIPIEPLMKPEDLGGSKFRSNLCTEHKTESLRWHCYDCAQTMCTLCRERSHRNHRCDDVIDVEIEFRRQVQEDIAKVSARIPERELAREKVEMSISRVGDKIARLAATVSQTAEELKRIIDVHTRALLEELSAVKQERVKALEYTIQEIDSHVMLLEGYNRYAQEISSHGTPCDLSRAVTDLNTRANQLSRTVFTDYDGFLNAFDVIFDASSVVTSASRNAASASTVNMVGRIAVTASLSNSHYGLIPTSPSEEETVELKRISRLDTDGRYVIGLSQLQDRLFVICGCSNTIRVYDVTQSYRRLDVIKISKMKDPADLSACFVANCLYVTDTGNSCIWRVTKPEKNGGGKVDKWLSSVSWPYKTSVTSDGRVLILSWSPTQINIYAPDGTRRHTVPLPADLDEPQNVLETGTGTYIITQGWTNSAVHRVVEVSITGVALRSYGSGRGSGTGQLDLPCHIAMDHLGRILIADYNNCRVVRLDSTLCTTTGFRECILASWTQNDSAREPRRVCFVKSQSFAKTPGGGAAPKTVRQISASPSKGSKDGLSLLTSNGGMASDGMSGEIGTLIVGLSTAVDIYSICS